MIGLGSNRLTVCRRGGMSVTQAGRGGMEWLAGGRMPSWASPYSAQATAALTAQFPTQWPTIRDYGFAHPALVPFINEDPMVICSILPELGKIRSVNGGGTGYFRTGVMNTPCDTTRFVFKYRRNATTDRVSFGNRKTYSSQSFLFTFTWNSPNNCGWNYGNGYTSKSANSISLAFHEFDLDGTTGKVLIDGTEFMSRTVATGVNSYGEFLLIGVSWNGSSEAADIGTGDFAGGQMYVNGELAHWYCPFKRNGVMEMMDIVTGNLCERVGTFTELIESPS